MAGKNSSEFIVKLLDQISEPAAKAAAAFGKIGAAAKAQQTTFESQAAFTTRLQNGWLAAATAATAASYAIGETIKTSVEAYGKFEEAMTSVQFQSGRTKSQMDDLESGFKKLSSAMYYGVADIARASLLIGESFKNNTSGLNAFMQSAENLARATGGSLADSVKMIGVSMRRLDIPDDQRDRVADFFTTLQTKTGASAEQVAAGVNQISNSMQEAGMKGLPNLQKMGPLLQTLTTETQDFGVAVEDTQKLIEFTSKKQAWDIFGDEVGHGTPEERLKIINKGLEQAQDIQERDEMLNQAGAGPRRLAMIEELTHATIHLAEAEADYNNDVGVAAADAERRLRGVEGQQNRIANKWKTLQTTMGAGFTPIIERLLDGINNAGVIIDKLANALGAHHLWGSDLGGDEKEKSEGKLGSPWNREINKGSETNPGEGWGDIYSKIHPHAQGGLFTTPHIGMVAESGPELIIPLSGLGGNMSATESSARGQKSLLNPLESIDKKMSKLVEFWTRGFLGSGPGDEAAGGGLPYSGGRGRGGGESPQRGIFGHRGGGNEASGEGWSGKGVHGWWTPERIQHGIDVLKKGGVSQLGAEAIISRWVNVESAGGPGSRNPTSGAIGTGQWLGKRKIGVTADYDNNLQHTLTELHGSEGKALKRLNSATTDEEAATGASMFERAEGYSAGSGRDNFTGRTAKGMQGIRRASGSASPGSPGTAADKTSRSKITDPRDVRSPNYGKVPFHDYHKDMSDAGQSTKVAIDTSAIDAAQAKMDKLHASMRNIPRGKAHVEFASNDKGGSSSGGWRFASSQGAIGVV
jgi:hypothetical protein